MRPASYITAWLDGRGMAVVQFLRWHPAVLLDCGGRPCVLGPFMPGDLARLPEPLAGDLIRRGIAREFSLAGP